MTAILVAAVRLIGITGCVALAIVVFYEGVPLGPLRHIPILGPGLADLVDGRVDRAFRDGQMSERLVWQENQRRALHDDIEREKAKQAELDAIAAKYRAEIETSIGLAIQISGLEESLAEALAKETEVENPPRCSRRPFIPADVSRKLDAVGNRHESPAGAR